MKTMKKVTLSNGIIVGNFNSPHSFLFEDGSILDADLERCKIMLDSQESVRIENVGGVDVRFVTPTFSITHDIERLIDEAWKEKMEGKVDRTSHNASSATLGTTLPVDHERCGSVLVGETSAAINMKAGDARQSRVLPVDNSG